MIARRKTPRPLALWTTLPNAHLTPSPKGRQREKNGAADSKSFTQSKSFWKSPRQKPIKKVSTKKQKSDRLYMAIAKEHRQQPGNGFCRVEFALTGRVIPATHTHHIRGRLKTLKFDTRFFCHTTFENNLWPHQNPEKAQALGLIAGPGEWNVAPDDAETAQIKQFMQEKGIW
jgi:hypothetical protein